MPRLFIGIPIPSPLIQDLNEFKIIHKGIKNAHWTVQEKLHITLYFFAEVPEEILENFYAVLDSAVQEFSPFEMIFDKYTLAPPGKTPRMIWARYKKIEHFTLFNQRIHHLYQQIHAGLQRRKSPIPHITLARLKNVKPGMELKTVAPPSLKKIWVDKLVLWESIQRTEGHEYVVKKVYSL